MALQGAKAERLYQELAGSVWSTTNWDGAVITLEPEGKVTFTKGGHQLTWSLNKAGELQFSDSGTAPKKATLSSRRDSFVLGMAKMSGIFFRIHRRLLQHPPQTLGARIQNAQPVRSPDSLSKLNHKTVQKSVVPQAALVEVNGPCYLISDNSPCNNTTSV